MHCILCIKQNNCNYALLGDDDEMNINTADNYDSRNGDCHEVSNKLDEVEAITQQMKRKFNTKVRIF